MIPEKTIIMEMARVDKNHICEVRAFPNPPADVKTVMTAVLLLLGEDEHTASVSMCVCTVTEMAHTRPACECIVAEMAHARLE